MFLILLFGSPPVAYDHVGGKERRSIKKSAALLLAQLFTTTDRCSICITVEAAQSLGGEQLVGSGVMLALCQNRPNQISHFISGGSL